MKYPSGGKSTCSSCHRSARIASDADTCDTLHCVRRDAGDRLVGQSHSDDADGVVWCCACAGGAAVSLDSAGVCQYPSGVWGDTSGNVYASCLVSS